jgi:pimeloyl-ACP methyl ester carboxylesterase
LSNKVFLISGLGADGRLFKNLDLSGFDVVPVTWIEPAQKDNLSDYAGKLIGRFGITPQSSVIGVSLGGMLTVEIAKQVALKHTIIISSIKSGLEAPFYFKFFRSVPLHKILSGEFIISIGFLLRPLFGKLAGKKEGQMFYLMLKNTSPKFIIWAMRAVLDWDGKPAAQKINHIIGDADLIFSHKKIKDAIVIPKGDHMMVFTRAAEITKIIRNILNG